MKYCPLCKRQFDEAWLSFCSDDGTPLIQELTPPADPNWNPRIREPKVKTPDEEKTQWLPREPPLAGGWIAPDERPPMSPGPWAPAPPPAPFPFVPGAKKSEGLSLASMIVGIAGFLLAGCFGRFRARGVSAWPGRALSNQEVAGEVRRKPYATAGVILGAISIFFYGVFLLWIFLGAAFS